MILLKHKSIHWFFWVFTISVAFILTLPTLVQDGMFMDGTLYSAVSHNLANGIGTFWYPSFSYNNVAGIPGSFHEQPPLVFGIQALFFKLLGDSFYVERLYIFVCLLLNIFLIKKLWEVIFRNDEHSRQLSWLPVLLWITIPVCFWSFSNNMHENTVSIFILLSVLFIYELIDQKEKIIIRLILAGLCIFLASFSKGLPGLFPIFVPFAFLYKQQISFKKALLYTLVLFAIVATIYGILLMNSSARGSLYNYFVLRLLKRVNDVPTTTVYLYTLFRLIMESGIMLGIAFIIKFSTRKFLLERTDHHAKALTFVFIGLLGILPLMLTLVQKGFYMVPALPFLAIGIAIYISPQSNMLVTKLDTSKLRPALNLFFIALAIASITLPILNIGKISREKEVVEDAHHLADIFRGTTPVLNCSKELISDWSLQTYLARYGMISLDINQRQGFYLLNKANPDEQIDTNAYQSLPLKFNNYRLFQYKGFIMDDEEMHIYMNNK
jgi:hypothetical protein